MKLVVALGNPGSQYNFTRHNFGFLALDFYFKVKKINWNDKLRYDTIWAKENDVIFIKPQDFYNDSGKAVQRFAKFYKIPISEILVICDDFDLEFGDLRYRAKGSAGGNNGLKSIISELKTDEFKRIRLGTNNEELRKKIGDVDFVLSKFTAEEKAKLPEVLMNATIKIDEILQ